MVDRGRLARSGLRGPGLEGHQLDVRGSGAAAGRLLGGAAREQAPEAALAHKVHEPEQDRKSVV